MTAEREIVRDFDAEIKTASESSFLEKSDAMPDGNVTGDVKPKDQKDEKDEKSGTRPSPSAAC